MSTPLKVRGIGASKHKFSEFAALSIYFPGKNAVGDLVYAAFWCEIHFVEGLCANLLIGNDIISPEGMVINLGKKTAIIVTYEISIDVNARQRGQFFARKLLTNQDNVIPFCSEAIISLEKLPLPDDQDFLFYPALQANLTLYSYIMDYEISKILVKNASNLPFCVPRWHKLGHLIEMTYNNCFLLDTESAWIAASLPPSLHPFFLLGAEPILPPTDALMETVLENGIKVFGDADAVRQISDLVAEYPSIWESQGFVQIPLEQWMTVPLKPGWKAKVSAIKPRVYPLRNDARWLVDDTFNKLHQQDRMKFTSDPTPFSFPVFVVWKSDSESKKKGRAVVDICKLNDLVLPNSYPLPLQSEIIANIQGCTNLAVLDAVSFFYQWCLHLDYRFMFTVVTDCGQETFQVPIIGYINLVAYVQQEIDNILCEVRAWAQAYVDDIVCGAKSLPDLLSKLRVLFDIFLRYNILIKPTKSFLNYPDVGLLGQKVNSLGSLPLTKSSKPYGFSLTLIRWEPWSTTWALLGTCEATYTSTPSWRRPSRNSKHRSSVTHLWLASNVGPTLQKRSLGSRHPRSLPSSSQSGMLWVSRPH